MKEQESGSELLSPEMVTEKQDRLGGAVSDHWSDFILGALLRFCGKRDLGDVQDLSGSLELEQTISHSLSRLPL